MRLSLYADGAVEEEVKDWNLEFMGEI